MLETALPPEHAQDADGRLCSRSEDTVNRWIEHFAAIEGGIRIDAQSQRQEWVENLSSLQQDSLVFPIENLPSLRELEFSLRQVKPGKASGPDGIPSEICRYFPGPIAKQLHIDDENGYSRPRTFGLEGRYFNANLEREENEGRLFGVPSYSPFFNFWKSYTQNHAFQTGPDLRNPFAPATIGWQKKGSCCARCPHDQSFCASTLGSEARHSNFVCGFRGCLLQSCQAVSTF